MKLKIGINNKGFSFVDLIIGMSISSILILGASKTYSNFTIKAYDQTKKAFLNTHMKEITQLLEIDLRKAGYGLPGNGIDIVQNSNQSDELVISVGDPNHATNTTYDLSTGDYSVFVADTVGLGNCFRIMIVDVNDTLDLTVISVYQATMYGYELHLYYPTTHKKKIPKGAKVLYVATIRYGMYNSQSGYCLTRATNVVTIPFPKIKNFAITAKDSVWDTLSTNYDQARLIGIALNGLYNIGKKKTYKKTNLEIALRNYR